MFKDVTGHAIGAYIRARRLSEISSSAACASILDIALQYRFDSQQTFTRAFKQFSQTPALYRRSSEWSAFVTAALRLGEFTDNRNISSLLEDALRSWRHAGAIPAFAGTFPTSATKCACNSA